MAHFYDIYVIWIINKICKMDPITCLTQSVKSLKGKLKITCETAKISLNARLTGCLYHYRSRLGCTARKLLKKMDIRHSICCLFCLCCRCVSLTIFTVFAVEAGSNGHTAAKMPSTGSNEGLSVAQFRL